MYTSVRRALSRRDPTTPARSRYTPLPPASRPWRREAPISSGDFPSMSLKNLRNSDSIRVASCLDVFAKPNASDASPSPVNPASVRRRTISHTVRAVARTGKISKPVTRRRGIPSTLLGAENIAAATNPALPAMNARRLTCLSCCMRHFSFDHVSRRERARFHNDLIAVRRALGPLEWCSGHQQTPATPGWDRRQEPRGRPPYRGRFVRACCSL